MTSAGGGRSAPPAGTNDDHLSLVAGISRLHRRTLEAEGVETLERLATLPLPLPFSPERGSVATYVRVREQARVQLEGRLRKLPVHELLQPFDDEHGLARLPPPSPGDIFLDFEGDPFVPPAGREFLVGFARMGSAGNVEYRHLWALSDAEERAAFESLVDAILAAWEKHPGLHVYHYAPYEPAALKRLMQRHATRQEEVDRMLRAELFVDLYGVVKHALRASVESYSIKALEPFYGFGRDVDLRKASAALHTVERALELGEAHALEPQLRAEVESYNRDDCVSALKLRGWLEGLRAEVERSASPSPGRRRSSRRKNARPRRTSSAPGRWPTGSWRECRPTGPSERRSSTPGGSSPISSAGTGGRSRPRGGSSSG